MGTFREHLDKYSLFSGRNILVRKLGVWSVSVDAFSVPFRKLFKGSYDMTITWVEYYIMPKCPHVSTS